MEQHATPQLFVALVANNDMKPTMVRFVEEHLNFFKKQQILTTSSTGEMLEQTLGVKVARKVRSGPLGGDLDVGAMVSRSEVAAVFFFKDPLSAHPHDADIVALSRICDVYDVMTATNPSSARALVFAMQFSPAGRSSGGRRTSVVKNYQDKQTKVIQVASASCSAHEGKKKNDTETNATLDASDEHPVLKNFEDAETKMTSTHVLKFPSFTCYEVAKFK